MPHCIYQEPLVEMFLFRKLRCFLDRFDLLQDNVQFLDDTSKYVMVLSRLLLHFVNLWPMDYTMIRKVIFYATMGIANAHHIVIVLYCYRYVRNIDDLTEILPAVSLALEVGKEISFLYL